MGQCFKIFSIKSINNWIIISNSIWFFFFFLSPVDITPFTRWNPFLLLTCRLWIPQWCVRILSVNNFSLHLIEVVHSRGLEHWLVACTATTQSHRKMHILLHDCNSSAVDSAEIGIFKEAYQECLGGFLKGKHCIWLKPDLVIDYNLLDNSLEWQSLHQKATALLILLYFPYCNRPWPEPSLRSCYLFLSFLFPFDLARSFSRKWLLPIV